MPTLPGRHPALSARGVSWQWARGGCSAKSSSRTWRSATSPSTTTRSPCACPSARPTPRRAASSARTCACAASGKRSTDSSREPSARHAQCTIKFTLSGACFLFPRPLWHVCPCSPPWRGFFVSKGSSIDTIVHAARLLKLPLRTPTGAPAWGGHALRRGGAQFLGASGVDVARIQALARHSSSAILGYLND